MAGRLRAPRSVRAAPSRGIQHHRAWLVARAQSEPQARGVHRAEVHVAEDASADEQPLERLRDDRWRPRHVGEAAAQAQTSGPGSRSPTTYVNSTAMASLL